VLSDLATDMKIGMFLAFCRTFGVPSIGGLLASTGQTSQHARRRAVNARDTMYALFRHGLDEPEGVAAVRRLQRMHERHAISNDDNLYILGCLAVVPTRFADRFGRRSLTGEERAATHALYQRLTGLMGIDGVPGTYAELEGWFDEYDRRHLVAHPGRRAVADRPPRASGAPRTIRAASGGRALHRRPVRRPVAGRRRHQPTRPARPSISSRCRARACDALSREPNIMPDRMGRAWRQTRGR
jgi:ER-bound oxygenase mpaB/B'/Rubber oxygenase, catalytic domain